jgi:hypothetical protein
MVKDLSFFNEVKNTKKLTPEAETILKGFITKIKQELLSA